MKVSSSTPKRKKKGPGDALGNGMSQSPIQRYYSPIESSEKSSPPYSPIGCNPIKRRSSAKSSQLKKKRQTAPVPLSQKPQVVVLSSDDSSDDVFSQDPRTDTKNLSSPAVPKARLNLIKKRLYPSTSSPISSSSRDSRPKTRRSLKPVRKLVKSRVLSDSESEGEFPMNNSHVVSKSLQNVVPQSSQVPQVRRRPDPETSSQAVVLSSSSESDFEFHNSKLTQSFLSQSVCGNSSQLSQRRSHSHQTSQTDNSKIAVPSTGTRTVSQKRSSLDSSSAEVASSSKDCSKTIPVQIRREVNNSSVRRQNAKLESLQHGPETHEQDSLQTNVKFNSASVDDTNKHAKSKVPLTLDQNAELSSIYLQETMPLSSNNDLSLIESDVTEGHRKVQFHPSGSVLTALKEPPSYQETLPRSPPPGHAIYHEDTIDLRMNAGGGLDLDSTVDFCGKSLTHADPNVSDLADQFGSTLPTSVQRGAIIKASDDEEDDSVILQDTSDMEAYKNNRTSCEAIRLSELLNVTHISGSDESNFSDIHSDHDDLSFVESSIGTYPEHSDGLATHMTSLLVEDSDDPEDSGITPILNSVLDESAEFFTDIGSSCGSTIERDLLEDGKKPENRDSVRGTSPTKELVNIALEVVGLETASEPDNSLKGGSKCADQSDGCLQQSSAMDIRVENVDLPRPENASSVLEKGKEACPSPLPTYKPLLGENTTDCESLALPTSEEPSANVITNGAPAECKIVCGSQPFETSAKLHIIQHVEKNYLPNKYLLLDTIISECQDFAEGVLSQEPLKSFVYQYSNLPVTSKAALQSCLFELLEDCNRWLKVSNIPGIDTLVSSGILEYLNKNVDLVTKLNCLTFSDITDVLHKLGNSPSKSIETMKNIVLNKFSSVYTSERVKEQVTDLIDRKFVKLTESASICINICVELFGLPLNLCDKFYKTVDVARFANALIRDLSLNKFQLLPIKPSKMLSNERILSDLTALCRLKSNILGSGLNDESIYFRVNDICSSIAVLDVSAEFDTNLKTIPTYKYLVTNYVHALDEQLKTLLYLNTSDIEFGACIYLGFLLKQNVTGFQHKVKWCRERMKHLSKLFDSSNLFEDFSKILKEPVSPVESIVRSEFVSNALKVRKIGLSPDKKFHLTKLLRPISHKKTQIRFFPLNSYLNYYSVLTKKPKGKNFNMERANIYENYKTDFPCGVEDNGSLLFNTICLAFWQAIYQNVDYVFVNKFQNSPLDWGSEEFFSKRENYITNLKSEMQNDGLPSVFKLIKRVFDQFVSHRCVVDWQLVAPNMSKIQAILEALGLDSFLDISIYVLAKFDERVLGFPDIVMWNPESKRLKFLGLKKPSDSQYSYQILWLEKLQSLGVDAEELQFFTNFPPEQCSHVK